MYLQKIKQQISQHSMSHPLPRALLLICWVIPSCAAITVILLALLTLIELDHHLLAMAFLIAPFVAVGILPWFLLTYVLSSKRFGLAWHWIKSALASLLAIEAVRQMLSGAMLFRSFRDQIQMHCAIHGDGTLNQVQQQALACGAASWLAIVEGGLVRTISAGLLLLLFIWAYRRFMSRTPQPE